MKIKLTRDDNLLLREYFIHETKANNLRAILDELIEMIHK